MKARYRIIIGVVVFAAAVALLRFLIGGSTIALLNPAGPVAAHELKLVSTMAVIMLIVAIPLLATLFTFAWKYREGNPKAKYEPDEIHGPWSQLALWAIPVVVIAALSMLVWNGAYALDPYKSIASPNPPLTVEVVALQWKWLFLYPQQNIATVNFLEFPEHTPIHFELTANAPMSSFWIPQLGSQIYAMNGMQTQLNLMADGTGEYSGKNTEINGAGYAGMTFTAKSVSQTDFENWVRQVQQSPDVLDKTAYQSLTVPSQNNQPAYFSLADNNIFNDTIMQFMMPATDMRQTVSGTSSDVMQMPGMQ